MRPEELLEELNIAPAPAPTFGPAAASALTGAETPDAVQLLAAHPHAVVAMSVSSVGATQGTSSFGTLDQSDLSTDL